MEPTNYICQCDCHSNPEYKHEGKCCFPCPKCKERVVPHLYNEHKACCSKQLKKARREELLRKRGIKVAQPDAPTENTKTKKVKIKKPPTFGSARTRYRKRPPINR